ncbi:hypothetical protein CWS35_13270 [Bradyrhizobium sp. SK17]|uniref:hypothetical protein n=1 Tax=Bradyrhizobium sp. SK17 TaxID=2057741 RepID=UPI000C300E93|nr:hypothetical protein [Bradyrhizobium sp. SK17]AUC95103.1 hypothetical protein CWS35_13270 [Bradyrhizobium sp. SK17]
MPLGEFIEPDRSLEDIANPAEKLGIELFSGFRALYTSAIQRGQNRIFDRIIDRQQQQTDLPYEDQCSSQYYFDLVRTLRDFNGQYDRVAEVGVYMGGASAFIAGCMGSFDFDLDLIDLHAPYLQFTHERVRRLYPEAARRIRLFHGDLPSYVRRVIMKETGHNYVVHHDGAHDFNGVVKDMASLFYVKDSITALIAQDTHLRGTLKYMNFVDLALHAVFGTDMSYAPIGTSYEPGSAMALPNQYQGNYFIPGAPEGMVLPMSMNTFKYPHPLLNMDDFLPPEA